MNQSLETIELRLQDFIFLEIDLKLGNLLGNGLKSNDSVVTKVAINSSLGDEQGV